MQKKNLCLQSRFFQSPGKKGSGQIMYQCTRNWGTIKLTGKWRLVLVRLILSGVLRNWCFKKLEFYCNNDHQCTGHRVIIILWPVQWWLLLQLLALKLMVKAVHKTFLACYLVDISLRVFMDLRHFTLSYYCYWLSYKQAFWSALMGAGAG